MLEREANRRYVLELTVSISVGRPMDDSPLRTAFLLSPLVPIALVIWAIARAFRRMDEFVRLQSLEIIGISAAITAGWTLTYGFLETAGFPRLSMFTVWMVMGSVWAVLACVRRVIGR